MYLKNKTLRFFSILALVFGLIFALNIGLFLIIWPKVDLEEIKPLTLKALVEQKQSSKATVSTVLQLTEEIKSSKPLNLNFVITTDKGNDLLVLVNKKISLPASFVPSDLVDLTNFVSTYQGAQLKKEAALALREMFESARVGKNFNFFVVSAYRSYQEQANVFNSWTSLVGLANAENFSAKAGHSQHQLGTTVDLGISEIANFNESLGSTPEGIWLAENSYRFGFVLAYPKGKETLTGYSYEPWHFRYIGKENAQKMISSGLILEEFLQRFGVW